MGSHNKIGSIWNENFLEHQVQMQNNKTRKSDNEPSVCMCISSHARVSVAPTNIPRSYLPHSWQFMLYILLVSQLDMQYLRETFGWTFGISTPNCAPTFEAHKAASGHHPLFTWLARLDTVNIFVCLIYSNYNRADLFKMHVNDSMMLIL